VVYFDALRVKIRDEGSGWKERQALARELKAIYRAETAEAAAKRLTEFEAGPWGKKYPMIAETWRCNWQQIIPFYQLSAGGAENHLHQQYAIESLHMQLRKVLKNRGHFPSHEAATKLIYLALRNIRVDGMLVSLPFPALRRFAHSFVIFAGDEITILPLGLIEFDPSGNGDRIDSGAGPIRVRDSKNLGPPTTLVLCANPVEICKSA
jgi:hypothetical protein